MEKREKGKLCKKLAIIFGTLCLIFGIIFFCTLGSTASIAFIAISVFFFVMAIPCSIGWVLLSETPQEKIKREQTENSEESKRTHNTKISKLKPIIDYCNNHIPNIYDKEYFEYTEKCDNKIQLNDLDELHRYVTLASGSITACRYENSRSTFFAMYRHIQSIRCELSEFIFNDYERVSVRVWLYFYGLEYDDDTEKSEWKDTCAHIDFDEKYAENAKEFCDIVKTIIALRPDNF